MHPRRGEQARAVRRAITELWQPPDFVSGDGFDTVWGFAQLVCPCTMFNDSVEIQLCFKALESRFEQRVKCMQELTCTAMAFSVMSVSGAAGVGPSTVAVFGQQDGADWGPSCVKCGKQRVNARAKPCGSALWSK